MRMSRLSILAVTCGALTLGACADNTVAPDQVPDSTAEVAQFGKVAGSPESLDDLGGRQIVVFKSQKGSPAGFEAAVAKLGGTVDAIYGSVGAAVVSGLDDSGAVRAEDLLLGVNFTLTGKTHHIELDPSDRSVVIWRLSA